MPFPRALVPALVLALSCAALPARADERAIAQQAFQEGRALMEAGRYAEACPKFAAAAELSATPGVRLNLSDCYDKLGKTASAWSKADEALALAERNGDGAAAAFARARKEALGPRLSYLTLAVAAPETQGLELTLDGERLPRAVWGAVLPVDPGEHALAARAPGYKTWLAKATVSGEAARRTIQVPALEAETASEPAPTAAPPATPPPLSPTQPAAESTSTSAPASPTGSEGSDSSLGTVGLVVGGVGIVGIGVGTALGLMAGSKKSAYEEHQDPHGRCLDQDCATLSQDALSLATGSTIGFIAGGALAATGAILWLAAPSKGAQPDDKAPAPSMALVPWGGVGGLGGGFVGSW